MNIHGVELLSRMKLKVDKTVVIGLHVFYICHALFILELIILSKPNSKFGVFLPICMLTWIYLMCATPFIIYLKFKHQLMKTTWNYFIVTCITIVMLLGYVKAIGFIR